MNLKYIPTEPTHCKNTELKNYTMSDFSFFLLTFVFFFTLSKKEKRTVAFKKPLSKLFQLDVDAKRIAAHPGDWEQSLIKNLYTGKGNALNQGNYRGFKMTYQLMKTLEHVLDSSVRGMVDIDGMKFTWCQEKAPLMLSSARQIQEKYITHKKPLYFALMDLEEAFDGIPRKVVWCVPKIPWH